MTMADKPGFIWFEGKLVPWSDAKIHVLTHGLHYGTGVFEGIRAYEANKGTAIFRLNDHVQRLFNSLKILNMKIPYDFQTIFEAIKAVVRENKLKAAYIRPICFYGDDRLGLSVNGVSVKTAIAAWEWGEYLGKGSESGGIKAHVSSFSRHHVNAAMGKAKISGQYVNSTLAQMHASAAGFDEAILLDTMGFVSEGSGENIFLVKNKKLLTPMLSSCLEGITRDSVIAFAADLGIPVIERNITRDELYTADEVFFTGTAAEITPICSIDHREVGSGKPGAITKLIQTTFFDCVHGRSLQHNDWLSYV
jgi:branched-chain amino acid aminotransferase